MDHPIDRPDFWDWNDMEGGEDRHLEAAYEDRFALDGPEPDVFDELDDDEVPDDDEDAWALSMESAMLGGPFDE